MCVPLCPGGWHEPLTALLFSLYFGIDVYKYKLYPLLCPKNAVGAVYEGSKKVEITTIDRCRRDELMSRKVWDIKSQDFAFPDFSFIVHSMM